LVANAFNHDLLVFYLIDVFSGATCLCGCERCWCATELHGDVAAVVVQVDLAMRKLVCGNEYSEEK